MQKDVSNVKYYILRSLIEAMHYVETLHQGVYGICLGYLIFSIAANVRGKAGKLSRGYHTHLISYTVSDTIGKSAVL